jgi:hypothetical protein
MFVRTALSTTCLAIALTGCADRIDRVPPAEPFRAGDDTFVWRLAHGVTGSLAVSRVTGAGSSTPQVVMICSGMTRGGLQVRDADAQEGRLQISAGSRTFAVEGRPYEGLDRPAGYGEGDFPEGWFEALSTAQTVSVGFADRTAVFKGPGGPAVAHFRRYCEELDRRAPRRGR